MCIPQDCLLSPQLCWREGLVEYRQPLGAARELGEAGVIASVFLWVKLIWRDDQLSTSRQEASATGTKCMLVARTATV
jgi:hypothetical protein